MRRTPIYHRDNPDDYRVVFRHPNLWVAQHNSGLKSSREFDPWTDLGKLQTTQEQAMRIMHDRCPLKPVRA